MVTGGDTQMAKMNYVEHKPVVERGNSKYILLPATIVSLLRLETGDNMKLATDGTKITITKED